MTAGAALLVAVVLDLLLGELPNRLHPVAWMGSAIARGRDWALPHSPSGQFVRGAFVALGVPALSSLIALLLVRAVAPYSMASWVVTIVLLKPLFAIRALRDAAFGVRDALVAGDTLRARSALGSLCSRKADALDEPSLIAAAIESVAENASDSIVAPLFYFALAGVPAATFYRASNTADAMIGYHGRFEWVGKTAARLDDLLNLVPARLTALLLLAAAPAGGGDIARGAAIMRRDGGKTESPNAGRPMAAMAGMLGLCLEKPGNYALGDATRAASPADITRACRIVSTAAYLAAFLMAGALTLVERLH